MVNLSTSRPLQIIRKYNVEPILFLYMVARSFYMPTLYNQLITDKLCLNTHHHNVSFCYDLDKDEYKTTPEAIEVLSDSVNYVMFGQLILSVPSILAAIFLGPWLDLHGIAPKIVLYLTITAGLFEAIVQWLVINVGLILVSHILNGITGGSMLCMTAVFTIAMKETPLSERTFRFTIIELAMISPTPIANWISATLLSYKPWVFDDQLRNYLPIYSLTILLLFISLIYTFLLLGEVKEVISPNDDIVKRASLRTSIQPLSTEYLTVKNTARLEYTNQAFDTDEDGKELKLDIERFPKKYTGDSNNNFLGNSLKKRSLSCDQPLPVLSTNNATNGEMFKSLFRLKNVTTMVRSTLKRREEKAHILLFLIITIYVILLVFSNGMPLIMTTFIARVYGMKPQAYMKIDGYGHLVYGSITTFCLSYFHKIDLKDSIIIIIGLFSFLSINLLRGLILNPWGLYLGYVTGSVYLCAIVACRGFVAKIIPENEIGTVLSVLSVFYAASPALGSFIYTQIWRVSMNNFPGLAFLVSACGTSVSIVFAIYLHLRYEKYVAAMEAKKTNPINSQITINVQ